MQPPNLQLPRSGLLGPDPEPLGTERYGRLLERAAPRPALASPGRKLRFEPLETRPLAHSRG